MDIWRVLVDTGLQDSFSFLVTEVCWSCDERGFQMQCYYFLGKYSPESLRNISAARTEACSRLVEELGGQIILMHATMGDYDIVLVINFESNAKALRASLALSKSTGITFTTLPAVSVTDFDKIADAV